MSRRARDTYIAIMVAAEKGSGVNLTWEECCDLSMDDAIATRAANSLMQEEYGMENPWAHADPYRQRAAPWNGANRTPEGRWGGPGDDPALPTPGAGA